MANKYMKMFSTSVGHHGNVNWTTMWYHYRYTRMAKIDNTSDCNDVEELEHSFTDSIKVTCIIN